MGIRGESADKVDIEISANSTLSKHDEPLPLLRGARAIWKLHIHLQRRTLWIVEDQFGPIHWSQE